MALCFDDLPFGLWSLAPRICVTAAVVGGAASLGSAVIGANAAQSAADTQAAAAEQANANTMKMYEETRSDLAPYRDLGANATPGYLNLLGVGPNGMAGALAQLEATPGYQFTQQQGLQAVQNGMTAQGLGVSGAAMKAGANYATGLAQSTYQNILGNYYSALNMGENAAAQTGQLGANYQGQSNQLLTSAAAAQAAGTVGSANAIAGGLSGFGSSITNAMMMQGLYGGSTGSLGSFASWGGPGAY